MPINKTEKIYRNLEKQARKLLAHTRQGSYATRERYFEAYLRFLWFLAERFRLMKISNVAPKHFIAYVAYMQSRGLAPATIKTDMAAIRFWHDQIPNPRHPLPGNEKFDLERRSFGCKDRTWSEAEISRMRKICRDTDHPIYEACMILARYAGLRIHECMRIDTATARKAIKTGIVTIKGKGGKIRKVPLSEICKETLAAVLAQTKEGHKLFVPDDVDTHVAIRELQNFIADHREKVQGSGSESPMTFHGLRHTFAARRYEKLISQGYTEHQAKLEVSKLLGHEREDVTRIYLASVNREDATNPEK